MPTPTQISSVKDACKFIREWVGLDTTCPGQPLPELASRAQPIVDLNDELGLLWTSRDHPLQAVLNSPEHPLSLFEYQDEILSPHTFESDPSDNGIVLFAVENQGVWVLGYDPDDPHRLWVARDWLDYPQMSVRDDWSEMREKWRKTEASVEEGIIFLLLGNFCIMFSNEDSWDFEAEGVPQDTDQLLWRFASWPSVAFWTNSQRTALNYAGSYLTLRR